MLSNNERTPQVIRNAMLKLGLEGNPDSYTLAQVLPDKGRFGEMALPMCAHTCFVSNRR
jgi:ral guanine nucleotide dissociation stimulator-like 1